MITIIWIDPSSEGTKPVLPPGVETLPAPGQAVVSPALDSLTRWYPQLAARYRGHLLLGAGGVSSGGELIAYVRPPAGRSLGAEGSAAHQVGRRVVGSGPVLRIGGFGPGSQGAYSFPVGQWASQGSMIGSVVLGTLAMLVLPGVIVLGVGAAGASQTRSHRLEVLAALGARTRTVTALAVLETLALGVPGFVVAVALWALIGPRLTSVPVVGYRVVRGDLALPWPVLLAHLAVAVVLSALVAGFVAAVFLRRVPRPRPSPERSNFTALRTVPPAVAVVSLTVGSLYTGYSSADFNLLGMVAAIASVPAVLPLALRAAGRVVGRSGSLPGWLAGRALQWAPARAARPFVGGAALLMLVLVGRSYLAVTRNTEVAVAPPGAGAVDLTWRDPRPGDLTRLADAAGGALVVPVANAGPGEATQGPQPIGATCRDLVSYFPRVTCKTGSPYAIPAEVQRQLLQRLSPFAEVAPVAGVRLVPRERLRATGGTMILDNSPDASLIARVRTAAMQVLPPFAVLTPSYLLQESPIVPWLVGGGIVAAVGLGLACLLVLVDRLLVASRHHRHLVNVGISRAALTAVGAWMFAPPCAVAVAVSLATGLGVGALLASDADAGMPWTVIIGAALTAVTLGVLGTATVALLSAKNALRSASSRRRRCRGVHGGGYVPRAAGYPRTVTVNPGILKAVPDGVWDLTRRALSGPGARDDPRA